MATSCLLPFKASASGGADSVSGLYIGKVLSAQGPYLLLGRHFSDAVLYLSPDGIFYEGDSFSGYDEVDPNASVEVGRYSVEAGEITLRYRNGHERSLPREGDKLTFGDVGGSRRLPNCDGLQLSGTYVLTGFGVEISFTPDGRFVDRGAMPQILNLTDSRLDSPARTLRPGSGTYSINKHTMTFRYTRGPTFRLFFYAAGDDHGGVDPSAIHIHQFDLSRRGNAISERPSTPSLRLPTIDVPGDWVSKRNPSSQRTDYVPLNFPKGRAVIVTASYPKHLPDRQMSKFPEKVHDDITQEVARSYGLDGMHEVQAMRRREGTLVPASSGVYEAKGREWWVTVFTFVSTTEGQRILFVTDGRDLHEKYLPTVRAMLHDADVN